MIPQQKKLPRLMGWNGLAEGFVSASVAAAHRTPGPLFDRCAGTLVAAARRHPLCLSPWPLPLLRRKWSPALKTGTPPPPSPRSSRRRPKSAKRRPPPWKQRHGLAGLGSSTWPSRHPRLAGQDRNREGEGHRCSDGNSSAASPKTHPPHAGSACVKTSWPGRFGQYYYPVLLALLIRILPSKKDRREYWLETFWKLSPIRRAFIIRAFMAMGFMLILALAVPALLLVHFHGQEMAQVWVMSLTLCSYAFHASLFIWKDWWFYTDFARLSYGPLLAYFAATAIGPCTAIFILHWSTVWAAGYLGCCIALHRLHKGTERGIHELPRRSCHSKYTPKELTFLVCIRVLILSVGWTMFMALPIYGFELTEQLSIVVLLSSIGWMYVTLWLYHVANYLMHGVLLKGPMNSLPYLIPCAVFTPTLLLLPVMLSVLLHWLLLMAVVGFLGYHLAVYICYLHTAAPWYV
ncbi:hypothetical protein CFC21_066105 [Triticum aestivum]|uniref:Uncharacterized protein n=2 Tax=Triticum aestivum TaxID=4565 RepID=A0A9R1H6A8_WHEAT|nr:hypothetical protein CFC21_066105 [Triticum aestivum]